MSDAICRGLVCRLCHPITKFVPSGKQRARWIVPFKCWFGCRSKEGVVRKLNNSTAGVSQDVYGYPSNGQMRSLSLVVNTAKNMSEDLPGPSLLQY